MTKHIYFNLLLIMSTSSIAAQVIQIKSTQEYNDLIKKTEPMVIQFAANWCGVCQKTKQPFEQVAEEIEFKHITFARVDIDALGQAGLQEDNITGVPTFVYRNNGVKKSESVGVKNMAGFKDELRGDIRKNLPQAQTGQDMPSKNMQPDTAVPTKESSVPLPIAPAVGFLPKIKNFFTLLIDKITELIKAIVDYVKGLFSR
ncbi:MAG: thioredoxin family protein [bacterium]|nr:thioredoxin family protein [bacterium]